MNKVREGRKEKGRKKKDLKNKGLNDEWGLVSISYSIIKIVKMSKVWLRVERPN